MIPRLAGFLFAVASYIVPKDKGLVAYLPSNAKGPVGNLRALFSHARESDSLLRHVWVASAPARGTTRGISSLGVAWPCLAGAWALLRARFVVVDSAKLYLARGRFEFVQLWHGAGYKNIGLMAGKGSTRLAKSFYSKCVFISANSSSDQKRKIECFENDRVYVTGSPRNDCLFAGESLRDWLGVDERITGDKVLLYAPTFREQRISPPLGDTDWSSMNTLLDRHNWTLLVKLHPADRYFSVPENLSRIPAPWSRTK